MLIGTAAPGEVSIDRQGRFGTFSVVSDQLTISVLSGCGDWTSNAISGSFEADKGKADDRGRDGSDRIIERSGSGSILTGVPLMGDGAVSVVTRITR